MNLIPRHSLFDTWFDRDFPTFRLLPETRQEQGLPAVDIKETDKGFTLKADFPGVRKEDISVTVDNSVLTLGAEYKDEKEEREKGKVIRQERRYGKYTRSFSLGSGIDEKGITAQYEDGVLTLDIPKAAPEQPKAHSIAVK